MIRNSMRLADSLRNGNNVSLEDWNQNGFTNRTDSTLLWTDTTPDRTLSVQPVGVNFEYFVAGVKYISTGDTVQITDAEGIHAIYYDGKTLTALHNPTTNDIIIMILTKALVSILYWDQTNSEGIYIGEERHGKGMSPAVHLYEHFKNGLVLFSGLGPNTMSVDGSGIDADAQFGIDAGIVADEDINHHISAVSSTVGFPIYHLEGAAGNLRRTIVAGFPVRTYDNTSATRICFNEFTGGAWQLTEVVSGRYVLIHLFASTEKDKPMMIWMGQNQYLSKRDAEAGANTEVHSLVLNDIMLPESRPIASFILQTNLTYANAVNGRIVSTDTGSGYVDHRSETVSRTSVSTDDHNGLTNVLLAQMGVTYGHIDDQAQTIAGTKTFSDGVIFPSAPGVSGSWWDNAGVLTKVP